MSEQAWAEWLQREIPGADFAEANRWLRAGFKLELTAVEVAALLKVAVGRGTAPDDAVLVALESECAGALAALDREASQRSAVLRRRVERRVELLGRARRRELTGGEVPDVVPTATDAALAASTAEVSQAATPDVVQTTVTAAGIPAHGPGAFGGLVADQGIAIIAFSGAFLLIVAVLLFELSGHGAARFWAVAGLLALFATGAGLTRTRSDLRVVSHSYLAIAAVLLPLTGMAAWVFLDGSRVIDADLALAVGSLGCCITYSAIAVRLRSEAYAWASAVATAIGVGALTHLAFGEARAGALVGLAVAMATLVADQRRGSRLPYLRRPLRGLLSLLFLGANLYALRDGGDGAALNTFSLVAFASSASYWYLALARRSRREAWVAAGSFILASTACAHWLVGGPAAGFAMALSGIAVVLADRLSRMGGRDVVFVGWPLFVGINGLGIAALFSTLGAVNGVEQAAWLAMIAVVVAGLNSLRGEPLLRGETAAAWLTVGAAAMAVAHWEFAGHVIAGATLLIAAGAAMIGMRSTSASEVAWRGARTARLILFALGAAWALYVIGASTHQLFGFGLEGVPPVGARTGLAGLGWMLAAAIGAGIMGPISGLVEATILSAVGLAAVGYDGMLTGLGLWAAWLGLGLSWLLLAEIRATGTRNQRTWRAGFVVIGIGLLPGVTGSDPWVAAGLGLAAVGAARVAQRAGGWGYAALPAALLVGAGLHLVVGADSQLGSAAAAWIALAEPAVLAAGALALSRRIGGRRAAVFYAAAALLATGMLALTSADTLPPGAWQLPVALAAYGVIVIAIGARHGWPRVGAIGPLLIVSAGATASRALFADDVAQWVAAAAGTALVALVVSESAPVAGRVERRWALVAATAVIVLVAWLLTADAARVHPSDPPGPIGAQLPLTVALLLAAATWAVAGGRSESVAGRLTARYAALFGSSLAIQSAMRMLAFTDGASLAVAPGVALVGIGILAARVPALTGRRSIAIGFQLLGALELLVPALTDAVSADAVVSVAAALVVLESVGLLGVGIAVRSRWLTGAGSLGLAAGALLAILRLTRDLGPSLIFGTAAVSLLLLALGLAWARSRWRRSEAGGWSGWL